MQYFSGYSAMGIGKQFNYLKRNFGHVERMPYKYSTFPPSNKLQKQYWVIQTVYAQQLGMYKSRTDSVENRIVSIHERHVRPIVRGRSRAKVEFGAKLHLSLVNGFVYLDTISWDALNESSHKEEYIENYKARFGFYPEKLLADKIYCT